MTKIIRHGNLVYTPIPKNGWTSFTRFFERTLGWDGQGQYREIDWSNDIVFAHITDPNQRFIKGTVEFLRQNNLTHILEREEFYPLLTKAFFDNHSYPLAFLFKDRFNDINWLPLDHPKISGSEVTARFLRSHNIIVSAEHVLHLHQSDIDSKNLQTRLTKIRDQIGCNMGWLLGHDYDLYIKVINQFSQNL